MVPDTFEELTKQFREAQTNIMSCLKQLNNLNQAYISKQEKQFMSTFLLVMDRMSNQLRKAQQQYQNIDKEIKNDYRCTTMQKELDFLHSQAFHLHQEFDQKQKQLGAAKNKNKILKARKQAVNRNLFTQMKQLQKYRCISQRTQRRTLQSELNQSYDLAKVKNKSATKQFCKRYIISPFQLDDEQQSNFTQFKINSAKKKINMEENDPLTKLEKSSKTRDSLRATQRQTTAIKFLSIDNGKI